MLIHTKLSDRLALGQFGDIDRNRCMIEPKEVSCEVDAFHLRIANRLGLIDAMIGLATAANSYPPASREAR